MTTNKRHEQQNEESVLREVRSGNAEAVRKWLDEGGRNNQRKLWIMLKETAECGHILILEQILGVLSEYDSGQLSDALRTACKYGQMSVAQLLVTKLGSYFDTHMHDRMLGVATVYGKTDVLNWLLGLTHLIPAADTIRWSLMAASARGDLTTVKKVVHMIGADVSETMGEAIWFACYRGHDGIVAWLLESTTSNINFSRTINSRDGNMTSLALACSLRHISIVKLLLINDKLTCDVNLATGSKMNTALHETIWNNKFTKLHFACAEDESKAVANLLYEPDVNVQDSNGRTPLHYACAYGHTDTVKTLLSVFADTAITSDYGDTPANFCERYGNPELANYLRELM